MSHHMQVLTTIHKKRDRPRVKRRHAIVVEQRLNLNVCAIPPEKWQRREMVLDESHIALARINVIDIHIEAGVTFVASRLQIKGRKMRGRGRRDSESEQRSEKFHSVRAELSLSGGESQRAKCKGARGVGEC